MFNRRFLIRAIEIVLGVLFVAAAVLKALDLDWFAVQIWYYGVIQGRSWLHLTARATVLVETFLGMAFLAGWRFRGWTQRLTIAMLVGFTVLIGYAWVFNNLKDCGCFGAYIEIGPGPSIAKNLVMLAMVVVAWMLQRKRPAIATPEAPRRTWAPYLRVAAVVLSIGSLVVARAYGADRNRATPRFADPERPLAEFRVEAQGETWDLGSGEYLVIMLSSTCDECIREAPAFNELAHIPGLPRVAGFVLGDPHTMEEFRVKAQPQFPTLLMSNPMQFLDFMGRKPPPRTIYARDGKILHFWEEKPPGVADILKAMPEPG